MYLKVCTVFNLCHLNCACGLRINNWLGRSCARSGETWNPDELNSWHIYMIKFSMKHVQPTHYTYQLFVHCMHVWRPRRRSAPGRLSRGRRCRADRSTRAERKAAWLTLYLQTPPGGRSAGGRSAGGRSADGRVSFARPLSCPGSWHDDRSCPHQPTHANAQTCGSGTPATPRQAR